MNNKCFYLVEGACERQLINALKAEPARLIPGSIIVHNVVQKTIPKAYVASFGRNSFVTMVFDTDRLTRMSAQIRRPPGGSC